MAEKWNGQAWHVVPLVAGGMNSVSCVSASFCMAAGKGAAIWDGARWHPMRGSPRGAQVSCSRRSFCMVARPNGAASWNGKAWHRLPLRMSATCLSEPECGEVISGLRCTSTSFCMAVGWFSSDFNEGAQFPVAEEWNGAKWAEISVPSLDPGLFGSGLSSVSCTSSSFCLAVGPNGVRVRWDGHAWTALYTATSLDRNVPEVSCVARDHCYLIDASDLGVVTFESWINGTWQTLQAPSAPAGGSISTAAPDSVVNTLSIAALSCGGVTAPGCTLAGGYQVLAGGDVSNVVISGGATMTLAERWTGGQWLLEPTPTPGDLFEGLSGVSCRGASFCMAVGSYRTGADTGQALAEQWNGHRWRLLHPLSPGTQINYLSSVSCPTRTECVAVGSSDNQTGFWHTLAELWNGTSWSVLPTLDGGPNNDLTAISCPSARTCMAVGWSRGTGDVEVGSLTRMLAERWDGTTWKVLATPNPGHFNVLSGISCLRPGWCMAVGNKSGGGHPAFFNALAMVWNGTSWRQVPASNRGGNMELGSVSCTRTVRCVAAGQYVHGGNPFGPVAGETIRPAAQVWNGRTWIVRKVPRLARGQTGLLNGVSCAARSRCMAVGEYITTAGAVRELADAWNGRAWHSVRITSLSSSFSDLFGIDCTAAARCLAVGEVAAGRTLAARWNGSSWHSQNAVNP